jgi:oligopeptide transport system ATP-binding protein
MDTKHFNILEVAGLSKSFPLPGSFFSGRVSTWVKAVNNVSFNIEKNSTVGLVGESGCGKSTVAKSIILLYKPDSGKILLDNEDLVKMKQKELRNKRKEIQMIFQDPYSSLNPKWSVDRIIEEPLIINKIGSSIERKKKVKKLLEIVGISSKWVNKYSYEFSGGQKQRISIARAISLNPKLLICDEPVSALDVSIKAQILNLLIDLKKEYGISYLFISHDLGAVKYISDTIAVMYLGKIVELTDADKLFKNPLHPYTKALLSAANTPDVISGKKTERIILKGELPNPSDLPVGCFFNTRCMYKKEICKEQYPEMVEAEKNHFVSCFMVKDNLNMELQIKS